MNQKMIVMGIAILGLLAIGGGVWLYDWVLGDTQDASAPISAPTLAVAPTDAPQVTALPTTTAEPTSVVSETASPTAIPTDTAVDMASADNPTQAGLKIYQISQSESQVRFNIFELLRGSPKDVIGISNQVAGQIAVDLNDLSTAQVGEIFINARTLATDDDRRNSAIRNRILFTDQFEYISFKPTQIVGLSGNATEGQSYTFQIIGDLTIRDITRPVTFDVSVIVDTTDRLSGSAKTTIQRSDFNLIVPDVPFVANVGPEVVLEIDFVLVSG